MTEPLVGSERAVDKHQAAVLQLLREAGIVPAAVGVYGMQGKPMRTTVVLYTQQDLLRVAALNQPWKLSLSRWAA